MLQFYTLELLELLDAHPAFIVFSADDPPANSGLEIADPWATKSITDVLINRAKQSGNIDAGKGAQLVFRLLAPATRLDLAVRSRVVPMIAADDVIWSKYPFLQLPVFFDALRKPTFRNLQSTTKLDFLRIGQERAKTLGARRHVYFKSLDEIEAFIDALESLPADLKEAPQTAACLSLIAKEITGDWEYLLEVPEGLIYQLEKLHAWLIEERWRFSSTYALSNVVTLLSRFRRYRPARTYSHCNLRNAQMDKAEMAGTRFHGVDLSGATITDAVIDDAWFYGVDLTRTKLDRSTINGDSRFVGCRAADEALANAKKGSQVRVTEEFKDTP